jgi:hypothetical protein
VTRLTANGLHGDTCGCCTGTETRTPADVANPPGLSEIRYRIGTWASFRESLLSRFTTTRTAAGDALDPRAGQNFAASLADAWAVVGDILTFYQERVANESYLRTATERRSVLELARMIGYELRPGVAAETWLAFTIDPPAAPLPPGPATVASFPMPTRRDAVLDVGLKVQSLPGPGEQPQTFETIEQINGWPEWNAAPLRARRPQAVTAASRVFYVKGKIPIVAGDLILILINHNPGVIHEVEDVVYDEATQQTVITVEGTHPADTKLWPIYEELVNSPLSLQKFQLTSTVVGNQIILKNGTIERAWRTEDLVAAAAYQGWDVDELEEEIYRYAQRARNTGVAILRFRQRAAIFGHNAPTFDSIFTVQSLQALQGLQSVQFDQPPPVQFSEQAIEFNAQVQQQITPEQLNQQIQQQILKIQQQSQITWVDELFISDQPAAATASIDLDTRYPDIAVGSRVILQALARDPDPSDNDEPPTIAAHDYKVKGTKEVSRAEFRISAKVTRLKLDSKTDWHKMPVRRTNVHCQSEAMAIGTEPYDPTLVDPVTSVPRHGLILDGVYLRLKAKQHVIVTGVRTDLGGETSSEVAELREVRIQGGLTLLLFEKPLAFAYVWSTVTVNANVARATHGDSTSEVLGSGNAGTPYQNFTLRQKPVTFVSAPEKPGGAESSLRVFVNDVRWHEVPTLYGRGPADRIFATRRQDDGTSVIWFGDGITGARVPSGEENVRSEYRKGIGLQGLVRANALSLLMSRPLGVRGVTNPLAATDAADPEPRDEARRNAPLQVMTLDRAVSLRDFEDFARGFAGVAKSLATRFNDREKPGVFVSVAGPNGAVFTKTADLAKALRTFGDPFVPIVVRPYNSVPFRIEANVKLHPDHVEKVVREAIDAALHERYSFEAQSFGQPVYISEAIAIIQRVPGVVSTTVILRDAANASVEAIPARVPFGDITDATPGADLLTLDPRPVTLTVTA